MRLGLFRHRDGGEAQVAGTTKAWRLVAVTLKMLPENNAPMAWPARWMLVPDCSKNSGPVAPVSWIWAVRLELDTSDSR